MKYIGRVAIIRAINNAIYFVSQTVLGIVVFLPYYYHTGELKASIIYPALALFGLIRCVEFASKFIIITFFFFQFL